MEKYSLFVFRVWFKEVVKRLSLEKII